VSYRPGTSVISQTLPTPRSAPTNTGVWFAVGQTDAGPLGPVAIRSLGQFVSVFGGRVVWSLLYDALDTFFNEGGNLAYVSRVVGPGAVVAFKNLLDAGAGISLVASAKGPGAGSDTTHGNSLKVQVLAGVISGYRIQVLDSASNILETSGDLTAQQDAVNWSLYSQYLNITLGATALVPAVAAAASLATGTDDRTNIVDAQWLNALNLFGANLGPGQVSAPGRTTTAGQAQLTAHAAAANNRVAILDLADTPTAATLEAAAVAARTNAQYGGAWTPWVQAPGIIAGTTRVVPPSAFIAALCARNDALSQNPNAPAAGDAGQAVWLVGLSQTVFDNDPATRQALSNSSVNVIRNMFGGVRNYGWRSLVDPIATPSWIDFGNVRLNMAISADAQVIEETDVFDQLDGSGQEIGFFNGQLTAMLLEWYQRGALYGLTPSDAFFVDTGPSVNTPITIANNELHAVLNVKMSPMAEFVQIAVVKVPITGVV
jgi:hypothetical protein